MIEMPLETVTLLIVRRLPRQNTGSGAEEKKTDEPEYKTNKMICAPSDDSESDQSSQCILWVAKAPNFLQTDTGQMPRII